MPIEPLHKQDGGKEVLTLASADHLAQVKTGFAFSKMIQEVEQKGINWAGALV